MGCDYADYRAFLPAVGFRELTRNKLGLSPLPRTSGSGQLCGRHGICHPVIAKNGLARPGEVLACTDLHTSACKPGRAVARPGGRQAGVL